MSVKTGRARRSPVLRSKMGRGWLTLSLTITARVLQVSLTTAVAASSGPCLFSVSQGCVEVDDAIEDLSDVVGQEVIGGASCGNQSVSPIMTSASCRVKAALGEDYQSLSAGCPSTRGRGVGRPQRPSPGRS